MLRVNAVFAHKFGHCRGFVSSSCKPVPLLQLLAFYLLPIVQHQCFTSNAVLAMAIVFNIIEVLVTLQRMGYHMQAHDILRLMVKIHVKIIRSPKTEKVQTCSRIRLNTSKLVFAMKMTLSVSTA